MRARKIRTMIAAATTSILASAGLAFPLTVAHAVAAGDVPICANNIITDKQANVKVTASGQETEGEKGPEKARTTISVQTIKPLQLYTMLRVLHAGLRRIRIPYGFRWILVALQA